MLRGERVLLRPIKRSDLSFFLKWFNDPEVIQNLMLYLPITEMAEERWIEELVTVRASSEIVFMIEIAGDKLREPRPIGTCGFHHIDHKNQFAEFDIAIGEKNYWGIGYGSEATRLLIDYGFRQLNLNRISSSVIRFNKRSIRLHKKIGFRKEGCRRKARFINGQFWNVLLFGLLREEWQQKKV